MKGSFHIADWEIQPQINCVTNGDRSSHLEPKVMQVLLQLASRPNEVLSKEELIHSVWADTFVGDDVLTRSISEIRRALEDDARSPKFIQTIPKVGYRLIVPIAAGTSPNAVAEPARVVETASTPARQTRRFAFWSLLLALFLLVAGIALWDFVDKPIPETPYRTVPFTSNLGAESQPSFSPDGRQVAFVWNGEDGEFRHIYVKLIGAESQLQVTSGEANDFNPVWSPDGTSLAFLRVSSAERGIFIVPAIGGAVRMIYRLQEKVDVPDEWERGGLSWSPDGKRVIFMDGKSSASPSAIYSLALDTMQAEAITAPPKQMDGDFSPAFSPDGSRISFVRGTEGFVRDVYVMPSQGGEPRRLTFDNRFVSSIAWATDSRSIIFSSNRGGKYSLWRVDLQGGEPQRLLVGGEDAFAPAVARSGNRLAYAQRSAKWSMLRVPLGTTKIPVTRILSSTEQDSAPQYSPDGSKLALQSSRSGTQEIWVCSSNGTDLVKLTSFGGPLTGSPSWSPDGQMIAFDSRPKGHSHIYVMSSNGGVPRALTDGDYNDIIPSWSHDGRWIYFGSNRSGNWQIWRKPVAGGSPQQVTRQGAFVGFESPDGDWLYFAKNDAPGIWRVPVAGGDEGRVLNQPAAGLWGYWNLSKNSIYYLDQTDKTPAINAYDLKTRKVTRVHSLDHVSAGITVSPDGKWLIYTELAEAGSHITLVENFR